jgi:mono/diheme cytochrome c family protein
MTSPEPTTREAPEAPVLYGLLAEFETAEALVAAARRVREAGYRRWDTYAPFPVHGLERAMGVGMTRLPWLVFVIGIAGLLSGLVMQWWMNAVDYPLNVAGKPLWSLPANVPIIFELTVLSAGVAAFVAVLAGNLLPEYYHPVFSVERFRRASDDRFFLCITRRDELFDNERTAGFLATLGAVAVEPCLLEPAHARRLPRGLVYGIIVVIAASLLPFAFFARARATTSEEPRVHLVFDMDHQPKALAQAASPFFDNGRAYRPPVPSTLSREDVTTDSYLSRGKRHEAWATALPAEVPVRAATLERGRERFGVFCSPCHALTGAGDGMVARRAAELKEGTWAPPTSLLQDYVRAQPLGQIVGTIANGIRNMPAYGAQIPAVDRWCIVAYIRALQRSQAAKLSDVPSAVQPTLR